MADIFEVGGERKRGKPDNPRKFKECIVPNVVPRYPWPRLIPSDLTLAFLDLDLAARPGRERILGRSLDKVRGDYDVILCDCPPRAKHRSLGAQRSAPDRFVPV
jgi:chromosome partitioning protein